PPPILRWAHPTRATVPGLYKRILVGFDGSPEALEALRRAVDLARALGAEVHVLTVVPPPSVVLGPMMLPETVDFTPLVKSAEEALERVVREHAGGVKVEYSVRMGEPAATILEAAEDLEADLIVLGRRRLRGLERVALGSVSSKVVNHAAVDVLVVRHEAQG
ncbi:MAG: universal stress protein, partial [Desulfurococcales archaeon]|nr:universal stress protein [Desulfurococcales archaeon]